MNKNIWISLCLLTVFITHRYTQSCGVGKTYDSENYVWASNTYAERGILENKDGALFLQQPPLFPLILSLAKPHQITFSSWLNTCCLLGTIYIWLVLAGKVLTNNISWSLYALCLTFATPLYLVHQFLWSEPIFLLLLSLHFWAFEQYTTHKKVFYWWLMISCGFLFCLQRSIGFTFILGTAAGLYFLANEKRYRTFIYLFISCSGIILWFLYILNYKTVTEFANTYGIQDNTQSGVKLLVESFGLWFLPAKSPQIATILITLGLFLGVLRSLILSFSTKKKSVFLQSIVYSIFFYIVILGIKKSDFSDTERFIGILYPLILLLLFYNLPNSKNYIIILIYICLGTVYPVIRCFKNVLFWKEVQCKNKKQ